MTNISIAAALISIRNRIIALNAIRESATLGNAAARVNAAAAHAGNGRGFGNGLNTAAFELGSAAYPLSRALEAFEDTRTWGRATASEIAELASIIASVNSLRAAIA